MGLFSKKGDKTKSPLDYALNHEGYKAIFSAIYIQDELAKLRGETIKLRIVKASSAKPPKEWDNVIGEYAVVDNRRNFYGLVSKEMLKEQGYKCGDKFPAFIGRPPSCGTRYTLYMPKSAKKREHDKRNFTFTVGKTGNMTKKGLGKYEGSLEFLPQNKGSSGKPRIGCKRGNELVFDIGPQTGAYSSLYPFVGRKCRLTVKKKKSKCYEGFYYQVEISIK